MASQSLFFCWSNLCDGEGSKIVEIYEIMDNMLGKIKYVMKESIYASYFPKAEQIVSKR